MRKMNVEKREKILDDLARLAGGTVGMIAGVGRNVQNEARSRIHDMASDLDLVPREDFDRLETLLSETLQKQKNLELRIQALENNK